MRLLLDTHALIWFVGAKQKLSVDATAALVEPESEVFVSAATVWEITTKFRLGKLPHAALIASNVPSAMAIDSFDALSISVEHGQLAGSLPGPHKDPFDRMLAAQAIIEGLTIVSSDAAFDQFGVKRLW